MTKRIRLGNGRVIVASEEFAEAHFPGDWTVDPDLPPPPRGTTITKLAFIQRFTPAGFGARNIVGRHAALLWALPAIVNHRRAA